LKRLFESMETITDTREALLDAAESLFAEHGVQAASLRAITQQAGANLAAVHYHFGSKEGLVRAVFSRRVGPLNEERLRRLDECERAAGGVEDVLRAFVEPLLKMRWETPEGSRQFARLMGRSFQEPNDEVRALVTEELTPMVRRFAAALGRRLPHLPEQEILWRFHFVAGAMAHTISCGYLLERYSEGACRAGDVEEALEHLITFLAAGLRAPAVRRATGERA
jgi:AcrR family transcriptional regulator